MDKMKQDLARRRGSRVLEANRAEIQVADGQEAVKSFCRGFYLNLIENTSSILFPHSPKVIGISSRFPLMQPTV